MADKINVAMNDGRTVAFGEKQSIAKDYGVTDGTVWVQLDFSNGETVRLEVDPTSALGLQALGHGLSQKLGDAASGAENVSDAFEAVLEVASRLSNGEWTKARAAGEAGGSAKGASELVEALTKVLGQSKQVVRDMLAKLKQGDKLALRKTPAVAAVIEEMRSTRKPSTKAAEAAAAGAALLAALQNAS